MELNALNFHGDFSGEDNGLGSAYIEIKPTMELLIVNEVYCPRLNACAEEISKGYTHRLHVTKTDIKAG
jgi:hypothetical protein